MARNIVSKLKEGLIEVRYSMVPGDHDPEVVLREIEAMDRAIAEGNYRELNFGDLKWKD